MIRPSSLAAAAALSLPLDALAGEDPSAAFEALAPVLVTGAIFGAIVAVVAIVSYAAHRARAMRHEILRLALEKGQPIPPELLREPERRLDAARDLRRGLTLLALGAGTALFFFFMPDGADAPWSLGFVPGLLGLGYLLTWVLTGRPRGDGGGADRGGLPAPGEG